MFNDLINNQIIQKKNIISFLLSFYGINVNFATRICGIFGISYDCNVAEFKNLLFSDLMFRNNFILYVDKIIDSKVFINENLKQKFILYKKIQHYKGKRLISKLPLNGQRTHTNAQTIKRMS